MKRFAAWRFWFKTGMWASVGAAAMAQAAPPEDVVIASSADAHAFANEAPFVFAGQTLTVHSSFATDRSIQLQRLAPVTVGAGTQFSLNGEVSSIAAPMAAPLEKRGPGTLALTGNNSYTSNTVLREGTLRLRGALALGDSLYNLQQHAGTVLQLEAGARVGNMIQVTRTRPGDVALPGLAGEAEWRVDSGNATFVNTVNAQVPVRKTGSGTLTLAGSLQGHPDLFLQAGALAVNAAASAYVMVGPSARLEGKGELAGAHISDGGMVAPGGRDSVATLGIWGDLSFDADGIYHVNAEPDGRADRLRVEGIATLDGRVWAEAGAGDWAEPNHRYLILSADGGLADTRFAGVDANLAFLDPALEYDADRVYLTLQRNDVDPGDVGGTPDEEEVGDVIEPPKPPKRPRPPRPVQPPEVPKPEVVAPEPEPKPEPQPDTPTPSVPEVVPDPLPPPADEPPVADVRPLTQLQQAIRGMSVEQVRTVLRQSTGSWHASVRSFMMDDSRYVRQAVLASGAGAVSGHDPTSGTWRTVAPDGHHYTERGPRSWAQVYSARGFRDATGGVQGDSHESHGLVMGLDAQAGKHWRPGVVLAAQRARLSGSEDRTSASIDTLHAGLSAHGRWDGMRVTVGLLRAWHRIDSRRNVAAGALQSGLRSAYSGHSWQAMLELAMPLRSLHEWGMWLRNGVSAAAAASRAGASKTQPMGTRMGPYLRHEWMLLTLPGHVEQGGLAAHDVQASTTRMHATTLGWRARHDWEWSGRPAWLEADTGWRRLWGDTAVSSAQHFAGEAPAGQASRRFTSHGQPMRRNALAASIGAGVAPWRNAQLSLRYAGLYGSGQRDHAAWADLRWVF